MKFHGAVSIVGDEEEFILLSRTMCAGNRSGVRVHDDPMINSVAHQSSLFFIFSTLISE